MGETEVQMGTKNYHRIAKCGNSKVRAGIPVSCFFPLIDLVRKSSCSPLACWLPPSLPSLLYRCHVCPLLLMTKCRPSWSQSIWEYLYASCVGLTLPAGVSLLWKVSSQLLLQIIYDIHWLKETPLKVKTNSSLIPYSSQQNRLVGLVKTCFHS